MITASADRTVRLWSPQPDGTGCVRPLRTLKGHVEGVTCLCWCSTGGSGNGGSGAGVLLSGSADKTLRLWSLAAHGRAASQPLAVLRGHGGAVTCVLPAGGSGSNADNGGSAQTPPISPAHSSSEATTGLLFSGGADAKVKVWDVAAASCRATVRLAGPCRQLLAAAPGSPALCWAVMQRECALIDTRCSLPVAALYHAW